MKHVKLEITYLPLEQLTPYKNNAKLHPQSQIDEIKASITEFGMNDPIAICGKDNIIVEGHGRLIACQQLNIDIVPIIRLDHLSEEQRRAYTLAHNKLTMNTNFDLEMLKTELESITFDMTIFGFEDLSIADMNFGEEKAEEIPEAPAEPKAKIGDIFKLGEHRLMCGSSTDEKHVESLMDGETADILFTSPPYSDMREYEGGKDLSVGNITRFLSVYKPYTPTQCVNLGIQRKNGQIYEYWNEYIKTARDEGYKLLAWNIWDKGKCGSIGQQSAFIPIRHEWIFVFGESPFHINETWIKKDLKNIRKKTGLRKPDGTVVMKDAKNTGNILKKMESVLHHPPEGNNAVTATHPATFPVGLPTEYISALTNREDVIIEPFCGSGTTLIACEKLGRKCYAMELEPKYVDVIILRWEKLTGRKAEKVK